MEDNNDFNVYPGDVFGAGNIIGDNDSIINNNSDDMQGPVIVSNDEEEEVQGPVIVGNDDESNSEEIKDDDEIVEENENNEVVNDQVEDNIDPNYEEDGIAEDDSQEVNSSEDISQFSGINIEEVDEEIKQLKEQKEEIEQQIRDLMDQKDEIDIKIREKEEALKYKEEVEMATDKLKMYIKDLEVKPGAVRDALTNLINNMDN